VTPSFEDTCFYTRVYLTLFFILSATDDKIKQHGCIKFCMKLCKSATETLEMFREALGEHSSSQTGVFE
jgi:hypothetical protein